MAFYVSFQIEDKKLAIALRAIATIGGATEVESKPVFVEEEPTKKRLTKTSSTGEKVSRFDEIVKKLGKKEFTRAEFLAAGEAIGLNKMAGANSLYKAGVAKLVKKTGKPKTWRVAA